MVIGVFSLLVGWIALMRPSSTPQQPSQFSKPHQRGLGALVPQQFSDSDSKVAWKYWDLLEKLQGIPVDEFEGLIPQLVKMLIDEMILDDMKMLSVEQSHALSRFKKLIFERCQSSYVLGFRTLCAIKANGVEGYGEGKYAQEHAVPPLRTARANSVVPAARTRAVARERIKNQLITLLKSQNMLLSLSSCKNDDTCEGELHDISRIASFEKVEDFLHSLTLLSSELVQLAPDERRLYLFKNLHSINDKIRGRFLSETSLQKEDTNNCKIIKGALPKTGGVGIHYPFERVKLSSDSSTSQARSDRQIININVEDCCLLSSKDHCPFLVSVETVQDMIYRNFSTLITSNYLQNCVVRPPVLESWQSKIERIRKNSLFSHLPSWNVQHFIVKSGTFFLNEEIGIQFVRLFQKIFQRESVHIILKPYGIIATGDECGLIEYLPGSMSIDRIKKSVACGVDVLAHSPCALRNRTASLSLSFNTSTLHDIKGISDSISLRSCFEHMFGESDGKPFQRATANFARSLAGYCVVSYVLQVKDRHNGNILLDQQGNIIHVDFGFLLGHYPGKSAFAIETAPFKMTQEYIDLLGGEDSFHFRLFVDLFLKGMRAVHKNMEEVVALAECSFNREISEMSSSSSTSVIDNIKNRIKVGNNHAGAINLINESKGNYRTTLYDMWQEAFNDIAS